MTTGSPRIVDAVFARRGHSWPRRRRRFALAAALGLLVHLVAAVLGVLGAPSLSTWSAELATQAMGLQGRGVRIAGDRYDGGFGGSREFRMA